MTWYFKDNLKRKIIKRKEFDKLILKSLIYCNNSNLNLKIYFFKNFRKFNKFCSVSFIRRSCLITHFARSVFKNFKMVRHQCRFFATNGLLVGLRKASF